MHMVDNTAQSYRAALANMSEAEGPKSWQTKPHDNATMVMSPFLAVQGLGALKPLNNDLIRAQVLLCCDSPMLDMRASAAWFAMTFGPKGQPQSRDKLMSRYSCPV